MTATHDAADARRILHEDRVSDTVRRARTQLDPRLWTLPYARDYLLAVLQLIEHEKLLRDPQAEREAAQARRRYGAARTDRENAYRQLALQAAAWSGIPGVPERLDLIEQARDDEEYRRLTARFESDELPQLVQEWRERRRATAEAAVQRARQLLSDTRKTVPMQALRDALATTTQEGQQ